MLRIVDRYIIKEVLAPFALSLLVFTFILDIPPMMDYAEKLLAKGVSAAIIARIIATLVPQALAVTIPMALLVGLLIGLGRLSTDRETVALQACGVSLFQMLRPVAMLAVAAWAATSYTIIVAVPSANEAFREITYGIVAARAENEVRPRVFFEDFPNLVLYVRDAPADNVGWTGVFLADTRQAGQPVIYEARRGRMVLDRAQRTVQMVLEDGTAHTVSAQQPDKYEVTRFARNFISLDPETVFPRTGPQKGDRESTIPELRAQVELLRKQGLPTHRPLMEIHKKFSIPIACLVFGLIGLALGVTSRKDGKLGGFVVGLGVIFLYYVIMYMGEAMAKGGIAVPWVAMWLADIILGIAGIVLVLWSARSTERRVSLALPFQRQPPLEPRSAQAGAAAPRPRAVIVIRVPQFRLPRPTVLDGYVARRYLRTFALAFGALLGIFYVSTFIDLSDKMFRGAATGTMMAQYFWYATPQFVYYIIPMSALIATLVTIGLLTKNSELVVIKACGISLYRVAVPLLLCGAAGSLVLFGLAETVLPQANRRAEAIRHVMRGGSPRTFDVLNRKWIVGAGGRIYHYQLFDPALNELNGLSVYEFDPASWQIVRRWFATRAAYVADDDRPQASLGRWKAQEGWMRDFDRSTRPVAYATYETRQLAIEPPDYFRTEAPDAERMSYRQLKRYIAELRASGFNVVPQEVALRRKVSFPFVTLIMTLIAVPFALTMGKHGALVGIAIGIVLALIYWGATSVFAAVGSAGLLAPLLAAWAPNAMFGASAAYLLLTVRT